MLQVAVNQAIHASGDSFRLGIIGDLHTHWDHVDLPQFAGVVTVATA